MPTNSRKRHSGEGPSEESPGKLLLVGGNEDRSGEMDVLRAFVAEAGGAEARIEVITTASSEPLQRWIEYERAFGKIGVSYAAPMHIGSRADAATPEFLERIAESTAVFFSGGDQLRITSILGATPVMEAVRRHFFGGGKLVGGTSAGAAALTSTIIYDGESPEALRKGAVMMTGGLGLVSKAVVDTHFMTRGRIGRLIQVVAGNPRLIGIGLGEDTGILMTGRSRFRAMGSGLVIIVDGESIDYTNVFEVEHMETFSVENVKVHVLSAGAGYDLDTRAFLQPPVQEPASRVERKDTTEYS